MEKILKEILQEQREQTKILQSIESRLKEDEVTPEELAQKIDNISKINAMVGGGEKLSASINAGVPSFYNSNY